MTGVEGAGRTIDEATERALKEIGARRDEVDVEILQEPRPALLGFGGREARVRLTRRPSAVQVAQVFTSSVLQMMGYDVTVSASETADGLAVNLQGDDLGGLIGRQGRTLDAIELLAALHVQRKAGQRFPVIVDAAGYRARREQTLVEAARGAADRAAKERTAVALEPMEPRDRRVVHLALRDDARVETASEGEDENRHVVVVPKASQGDTESPGEPQPTESDEE
ncbi:MAG: RNA-binding cell elongation regulator Jag/EloR [Armatimonadota bacterium]